MNPRLLCVALVSLTLCLCSVQARAESVLRVVAFNLYNPGNHPDATYERWGRELGERSDVMLLSEVGPNDDDQKVRRRAKLVADAAGMPYFETSGDVAIISRTQLYSVLSKVVRPDSFWPLSNGHNSYILSVKTNISGTPHQFIANHWGVRDVNHAGTAEPWWSSPTRFKAAQQVLVLADWTIPVFVGGDLNAYSGVGPQNAPGSTDEVSELRTRLTDVFIRLQNTKHCGGHRIDYVMFSGRWYIPTVYDSCSDLGVGSDHPAVLAQFKSELQPIPLEGREVACSVFENGGASITSPSSAIYFADSEQACVPDGSSTGACRRWFGQCTSADNDAVKFRVFDDGGRGTSSASSAVYNKGPAVVCVPDGTPSGSCRKWFGMAATEQREVECYLFDDANSNWVGPTSAIFYRRPGEVCMPNGAFGECRKWLGNCRVTSRLVQHQPPDPGPSPAHERCVKACTVQRDRCIADVSSPGGQTLQQCVAGFGQCQADCPP